MAKEVITIQKTADEFIKERDALAKRIVAALRDVRAQLVEFDDIQDDVWREHQVRYVDIFGEFPKALEFLFEHQAHKNSSRAVFGLPPTPTRQQQLIASCERNLEKQKALLKEIRSRKNKSYSKDDVMREPSYEDIERIEARVELAELSLYKARGEMDKYQAQLQEQADERAKKEREERLQQAAGIKRMQERTRATPEIQR